MTQVPLILLSDSPSLRSGLARITRDLAAHVNTLPEFRVATLGRGGIASRRLPWPQYVHQDGWGTDILEHVCNDFFGRTKGGVVMTIQDPSRMLWFSRPYPEMGRLYDFLASGRIKRWGYWPVDSTGIGDKLTGMSRATIAGYDRVLAYTAWGAGVIERSIGKPTDWIPHGYDGDKFQPRDKTAARMAFNLDKDDVVIACIMTNQVRKDWPVAFAVASELRKKHPTLKFIAHTDTLERSHAWNLRALAADFGTEAYTQFSFSGTMGDEEMSYLYSAADATILPSHEGFGYPLVESMACGTPAIHSSYGGGAELIPTSDWLVDPSDWRITSLYNSMAPVFNPADWVAALERVLEAKPSREECTSAVEHLQWKRIFPSMWRRWFLEGIER